MGVNYIQPWSGNCNSSPSDVSHDSLEVLAATGGKGDTTGEHVKCMLSVKWRSLCVYIAVNICKCTTQQNPVAQVTCRQRECYRWYTSKPLAVLLEMTHTTLVSMKQYLYFMTRPYPPGVRVCVLIILLFYGTSAKFGVETVAAIKITLQPPGMNVNY